MNRSAAWSLASRALPLVVLVGGVALALSAGATFRALAQEDGWGEWATFLAFGAAGALGLVRAARSPSRTGSRWPAARLALAGIGAFCVFVAGEEISWGQRLFGFVPPAIFLERNYQQEANLHNLLKDVFDSRWQVFLVAAGYGGALSLLAWRQVMPRALAPATLLAPAFLGVAALELAYPFELAGELAELVLGLAFAADVAARRDPDAGRAGGRLGVALQVAALLGAASLSLWQHAPDPERVASARAELALLGEDLRAPSALTPRLLAKERVHKRMFTAVREKYLRFGDSSAFLEQRSSVAERRADGRADRRGYFLDPWNQPYWLVREPTADGSRVLVYSFGPNRRRDSDVGTLRGPDAQLMAADDVGIVVDVPRAGRGRAARPEAPAVSER